MSAHGDGANKVKVGFFSFTEVTDPREHRSYNEWHQLDHLPEQYPLPGVVFGQRWVSTPACRAARTVDGERLRPVHYMTLYLMTEPVAATLDAFAELGGRLRALGRFHQHRRSRLSGPFELVQARAAPRVSISAQAVPYRPNLGVFVVVEEVAGSQAASPPPPAVPSAPLVGGDGLEELVALPGVAGVWAFAATPAYRHARWDPGATRILVAYLDGEPLEVSPAVGRALERRWAALPDIRPLLAGPLETIVPWHWDWFDAETEGPSVT